MAKKRASEKTIVATTALERMRIGAARALRLAVYDRSLVARVGRLVGRGKPLRSTWTTFTLIRLVFAAALPGKAGKEPTSQDAETPLDDMVEAIKRGAHGNLIPFDKGGHAVRID